MLRSDRRGYSGSVFLEYPVAEASFCKMISSQDGTCPEIDFQGFREFLIGTIYSNDIK